MTESCDPVQGEGGEGERGREEGFDWLLVTKDDGWMQENILYQHSEERAVTSCQVTAVVPTQTHTGTQSVCGSAVTRVSFTALRSDRSDVALL